MTTPRRLFPSLIPSVLVTLALAAAAALAEPLADDTPSATTAGHTFIAPAEWSLRVDDNMTIIEAPEGDSRIVLMDVDAPDADAAVAQAWAAYRPNPPWPLLSTIPSADKDGWTDRRTYNYQTSPNERRDVGAGTLRRDDQWTVWIYDMAHAVGEKRAAQIELIFGRLLPKGYQRESFTGRKAHALDAARIAELGTFVERGQSLLGVPGVSLGVVQDGKVVFAGGFGVRELGRPEKVDSDTLYMIASNTKAMTTLLLGTLVDEKKLAWDTRVTELLPQFKLGDDATTRGVLVRHLICACTGLPRQDFEWLLEFDNATPTTALATLGTMQPTSGFGELFQYSNPLAAAGGYVAGHVAFPNLELGAAYDRAMQERVFAPLGMESTTFDFAEALGTNHAAPHALDVDGNAAAAVMGVNYSIVPVRPAGGAWSNVHDMLEYVQMELANGVLPNGKRYVSAEVIKERRAPQVPIGKDTNYGMGLIVDTTYGVPVVSHGGSMIGYKSNMIWLPEHGVGAVVLTNSDEGQVISGMFARKLLEVLFDGDREADNDLAAAANATRERIATMRALLTVPPDPAEVAKLASHYTSTALGDVRVIKRDATIFDLGEFETPVASRKNPDDTVTFVTTAPGLLGLELNVGGSSGERTLVLRDAQHEYTFTAR